MPLRALIALLAAAPLGMFVSHAMSYRGLRAAGRRPTAHTSAIAAIVAWFAPTIGASVVLMLRAHVPPVDFLCAGAYVLATYAALAVLYMDVVNIAETSLHMHVLLEVMWTDRPSLGRLIDRYGAERMIAERIERLAALGQIREADGRYVVANRSTLRLSAAIDAWRRILGLPTSPEPAQIP